METEDALEDEEYEYPEITSFRRQLFACSSSLVGGASAGFVSQMLHTRNDVYVSLLEMEPEFINYFPLLGEVLGIMLAVFCLFVMGRKRSLIVSQTLSLIVLGAHEYYSLSLRLPNPAGVKEEFYCVVAQHACVRLAVFVMAVYVTEVAQPKFRAFFLGLFFVPFTVSVFVSRNLFEANQRLNMAVLIQLFAGGLALLAPETPYWLALKERDAAAERTFNRLTAGLGDPKDLDALVEGAAADAEERRLMNLRTPRFGVPLLKMFFMCLATDGVCQTFMAKNKKPFEYFRFDIYYDQLHYVTGLMPAFIEGLLPQFVQYFFPVAGSVLFLLVNFKFGRRALFIGCVFVTYVLYVVRFAYFLAKKVYLSWIFDSVCYLVGHMGGRPIMLLVPAEIFPSAQKEFGIAASEIMQILFQISDYTSLEYTPTYHPYNLFRLSIVIVGLGLTYLYMPETKDLTLVETQRLGVRFAAPILNVFYAKDEDAGEADII